MSASQTLRPKFFEGQYLGAEDLTAAVSYARVQDARHMLGAHTWGIAIGLKLKDVPQPGGRLVEVWLRYREAKTRQPSEGFEICDETDQNSRVQETFTVEIGERLPSEQHDNITLNGASVAASEAF